MPSPLVDKVRAIAEAPVEGAGYELVDVEWKHEPGGWILRVFIDKPPEPGAEKVGLEDCVRVSRELSTVLDVSDVITQAYSLEVSSPGLNRPLRTLQHFERQIGQIARVKLREGVGGRRNFKGTILGVTPPGEFTIEVDGQKFVLPVDDIEKANLEYQFEDNTK